MDISHLWQKVMQNTKKSHALVTRDLPHCPCPAWSTWRRRGKTRGERQGDESQHPGTRWRPGLDLSRQRGKNGAKVNFCIVSTAVTPTLAVQQLLHAQTAIPGLPSFTSFFLPVTYCIAPVNLSIGNWEIVHKANMYEAVYSLTSLEGLFVYIHTRHY